jgi:hypothetical protein
MISLVLHQMTNGECYERQTDPNDRLVRRRADSLRDGSGKSELPIFNQV